MKYNFSKFLIKKHKLQFLIMNKPNSECDLFTFSELSEIKKDTFYLHNYVFVLKKMMKDNLQNLPKFLLMFNQENITKEDLPNIRKDTATYIILCYISNVKEPNFNQLSESILSLSYKRLKYLAKKIAER
jgi:hypothetical protein